MTSDARSLHIAQRVSPKVRARLHPAFMSKTGVSPTSWLEPRNGVAEFKLTPRALKDLDAIAEYSLDKWGAERTREYIDMLVRRMQWLAENPDLGRERKNIAAGYLSFIQGRHIVFYIVEEDSISIIGGPHASMDIEAHFHRLVEG
jgi:toxin ParE1/3/4